MLLYYYRQLKPEEKELYRQMDEAVGCCLPLLHQDGASSVERLRAICRYVALDHPEYFWFSGAFKCSGGDGGPRTLYFDYPAPVREMDRVDGAIQAALREIGTDRYPQAESRARAVYDWMLGNVRYDLAPDAAKDKLNQTIYSVFMERKSLCMGIAKAFQLLLRFCDVDGMIALGRLFGDERFGHAWNMVRVEDAWLHVDASVAYPCFQEMWEQRHGSKAPCFLVSDGFIRATHRMTEPAQSPSNF